MAVITTMASQIVSPENACGNREPICAKEPQDLQREKEDANQRERHRPTRAEKDHLGLKYVEVDGIPNRNAREIGISERSY